VGLEWPESLGDRRRAHQVDEQKEAPLQARTAVTAAHEVEESAPADQAGGLHDDDEDERHREGEADRQQLGMKVGRRRTQQHRRHQAEQVHGGKDRRDRRVDERLQRHDRGERQAEQPVRSRRAAAQQEGLHAADGEGDECTVQGAGPCC
jgi:hypothetical protein